MLAKWIYKVVVVGNTCMHHVLLGIDPSYVGLAPYAPVMRHPLVLPARDSSLKVNPEARVCFLPIVAGFVGADAVARGPRHPHRRERQRAHRRRHRHQRRGAAGLARAAVGVLGAGRPRARGRADPPRHARGGRRHRPRLGRGRRPALHTIGEARAQGICGSGLIDAVAALLDAGVIDWTGLIDVERRDRLPRRAGRARSPSAARSASSSSRPAERRPAAREIVLTQDDVRQVQLCKGAIGGGRGMLQHVGGVPDEASTELMLAGGFGNYLSIRSALRIGLIPPLRARRIRYVGNAAALGAQLALVSEAERARAERLARAIEHVSLAAHPDFQDIFVDCMNFPKA